MNRLNWRDKYQCHVNISFPDGSNIGVWVPKDVDVNDYIKKTIDNWYSSTIENPKLHGHVDLDEKCPECGEYLHAKEYEKEIYCWCVSCRHQEVRYKK